MGQEDELPEHAQKLLDERVDPRWVNFSWTSPGTLLDSVNDKIAKNLDDLVGPRRMRLVSAARQARRATGVRDPAIEWVIRDPSWDRERFSFMVLGDPGEQDPSQYVVVQPLLEKAEDSDFMVILSDVIYPSGDINDYIDGFYRPYEEYKGPIYAVPGNHDWYDGLAGFMFHFCGVEPLAAVGYSRASQRPMERLAGALWRLSSRPNRALISEYQSRRATRHENEPWAPMQPGPYFAIDRGPVVLVHIDTGISGKIDREQGDWLLAVSRNPKPKIVLTGKPLRVNGEVRECEIERGEGEESKEKWPDVDSIVRHAGHRYVAAIGGDTHNYQRYYEPLEDHPAGGMHYVVSGGGGAYLSATHQLPPEGEGDELPTYYPSRAQSLALFTNALGRLARWTLAALAVLSVVAAVTMVFELVSPEVPHAKGDGPEFAVTAGLAVIGLAIAAFALVAAIFAGRKARTFHGALTAIIVLIVAGAAVAAAASIWEGHVWHQLWRIGLVELALLLVVVAAIVVPYFSRGFGPRVTGDVLLAALPVGLLVWWQWDQVSDTTWRLAATVAGAAAAIGLGAYISERARNGTSVEGRGARRLRYKRILLSILPFVAIALVFGFWSEWYVQTGVAVLAGWVVALTVVLLGFLWPALTGPTDLEHDDPRWDEALEPNGQRNGAVGLLAGPGWRAKKLNAVVAEVAGPSGAPFYKNFLRIDVGPEGVTLRCWGVTGLPGETVTEVEKPPVVIPFSRAPTEAP